MLMLNGGALFRRKVIRSARDGDIGAVFGIGFPSARWPSLYGCLGRVNGGDITAPAAKFRRSPRAL